MGFCVVQLQVVEGHAIEIKYMQKVCGAHYLRYLFWAV